MSGRVHVFSGPTIRASEVVRITPHAVTHPPVRHGDLLSLNLDAGDIIVIIDGLFHSCPAVRHKEILELISRGVTVVGAASMGALRAAELHSYGMIGVGEIFAAYRDGIIESDDEVAVVHGADDYAPFSIALVDIRAMLARAASEGVVAGGDARRIIQQARELHYSERNWRRLTGVVDEGLRDALSRLSEWRSRQAVGAEYGKLRDAREALRRVAARDLPSMPPLPWTKTDWHNPYIREWVQRFGTADSDGHGVSLGRVLSHQQLYDARFPERWRRFVLSWVAEGRPDAESYATDFAARHGLAVRDFSAGQRAYWLTEAELAGLPEPEQLIRVLVRSVPRDLSLPFWPISVAGAAELIDPGLHSERAVAAATRCNQEISATGPQRSIHYLRADRIRSHLAAEWNIAPADRRGLTAAARDRGFPSVGRAIEAARVFFLAISRSAQTAEVKDG